MKAVAIVDTSIFCNVLDIPNMNGEREQVMRELKGYLNQEISLLLSMAAVYETGNHIAQLSNGGDRRRFTSYFVDQVRKAIVGDAPWQVMQLPTKEEVMEWLVDFPESAIGGAGMGDLSIVKEWEN